MISKVAIVPRLLLGLAWTIFGINYFFKFMPTPKPSPEALVLIGALAKSGVFMPFVKVIETICGILLLTNRFSVLALVLITPILVGIALINFFLNPGGILITTVLLALHIFMVVYYWDHYKGLLVMNS